MRSFLQECDETYLLKAGPKKFLRNVTQVTELMDIYIF